MDLSFSNLFFVDKEKFPKENRIAHEEHQKKVSWVYYATLVLGFWLIAGPPTFGYEQELMVWNDVICGVLMILLSYGAMKPYNLWAQWGIIIVGTWLFVAPMIFHTRSGAALLGDFLIGTLAITFAIVIAKQPGIKLYAQPGPDIPPGWSYNPSSWPQRVPVIFLAWVGFFIARYMGAFQLEIIQEVWDPIFGEGTRKVLSSDVSESFPVSDATLGAFSYILDVLFGYAGGIHRWRTMPWVVIVFGILIIPLGVVSITLIILQPLAVGNWCTLCLSSALISTLMIPFTVDEVLATAQMMIREKKQNGNSYWKTLWFGGTMEGGEIKDQEDPSTLLPNTIRDSSKDLITRPWNLFLVLFLGVWIMMAPAILGYEGAVADSDNLVGALIVTFAVISMSEVARSVRFINFAFGGWMIAAPFVLGAESSAAMWNDVLAGAVLIALSIPKGDIGDDKGGFNKHVK